MYIGYSYPLGSQETTYIFIYTALLLHVPYSPNFLLCRVTFYAEFVPKKVRGSCITMLEVHVQCAYTYNACCCSCVTCLPCANHKCLSDMVGLRKHLWSSLGVRCDEAWWSGLALVSWISSHPTCSCTSIVSGELWEM